MTHYVLICGGRDYVDDGAMDDVFSWLRSFYGEDLRILHGDAPGADRCAGELAAEYEIPCRAYPADWDAHGKQAGMIRNRHMADLLVKWRGLGHTVEVIAFPGGVGTRGMMSEAAKRDIPVTPIPSTWATVPA